MIAQTLLVCAPIFFCQAAYGFAFKTLKDLVHPEESAFSGNVDPISSVTPVDFDNGFATFGLHDQLGKIMADKLSSRGLFFIPDPSGSAETTSILKGNIGIGQTKLCKYEITTVATSLHTTTLGSIPRVPNVSSGEFNWPSMEHALEELSDELSHRSIGPATITRYDRCAYFKGGSLFPVFRFEFRASGLGYVSYVDAYEMHELSTLHFHTTRNAKAYTYPTNPTENLVEVDIEVNDSGLLEDENFQTHTNAVDRVFSIEENRDGETVHVFRAASAGSAAQQSEITSFVNVQRALRYFESLGYSNPDGQIDVHLNISVNGSLNNALYQPAVSNANGKPKISISKGDGQVLKNLDLDADVISHEFGHHAIWRSIKNTTGESLVLHEGLADFFAFAAQGNQCLGESICPADSPFCWVEGRCLRTGDNTLSYNDSTYRNLDPHLKSQMVSGMLWDLYEEHRVEISTLEKTVYRALELLNSTSTIVDLTLALAAADQDLNSGANLCFIREVILARGLSPFIAAPNCEPGSIWSVATSAPGISASSTNVTAASSASSTNSSSEESNSDGGLLGFCALGSQKTQHSPLLLIILLLLPAVFSYKLGNSYL